MEVITVEQTKCVFLRQWETELRGRVLDPVHYLQIFDRMCERTFGYAPFLQKQYFVRSFGWQGHHVFDPAWYFAELRSLFSSSLAEVEEDGTISWRGWHYRDTEDILPYWAHETVTVRPSPWTESVIWVYWNKSILCQAIAEELRTSDENFRPYWFPYPRLGNEASHISFVSAVNRCRRKSHKCRQIMETVQTKVTASAVKILK